MTQIFFASLEWLLVQIARWGFFWPGDQIMRAAEWCHERAGPKPPG